MHKITNSNSKRYRKAYVLASEYALFALSWTVDWPPIGRATCVNHGQTRPTNGRASHAECLSDDRPPGTGILSITAIVSRIPYVLCISQYAMSTFLLQFRRQMFPDPQFIYIWGFSHLRSY